MSQVLLDFGYLSFIDEIKKDEKIFNLAFMPASVKKV